jgi:hypothetical protein
LPSGFPLSDPVRLQAYAVSMLHAVESFLAAPDCARYYIFAGYLAFMWGIVGLANYFDAVNAD